jgi:hypothetical protein
MFAPILLVILGLLLAFAGRRFIWLLIGVAGFVLGYDLVTFFIPGDEGTVQILIGVFAGLIGAFLAVRFTNVLLLVAGFVLIGNALLVVGQILGADGLLVELLLFVIGGVVGLLLVRFALAIAVILISALGGASLVMQGLPGLFDTEPGALNLLIGVVVFAAGLFVQWQFLKDAGQIKRG